MYAMLVRRNVRQGFRSLNAGEYGVIVRQFHPQGRFVFVGASPLGGERIGVVAVETWFQQLYAYFPGIEFTVKQVIVQGWPWQTRIATQLSIRAPRQDGSFYQNEAVQLVQLRWGRIVEDRVYEDTQNLTEELQQRRTGLLPPVAG